MQSTKKNAPKESTDLFLPASPTVFPSAPELSMDQYVQFLDRARLLENYHELFLHAMHRETPKERFVLVD